MKRYFSLIGALVAAAGFMVACQQPNFSHRIFVRNESGNVIAIAQIALPQATFFEADSFTGKWKLESWEDEFPKQGASTEEYRATRKGDNLRVNLNPTWSDNNVVLIGKQVGGPTYQGNWC
ncbi:MAG: hypothetical protein H6R15_3286 [Proteobacteria bacterium]|nr:hypothetical protein [Pseudomonadota bacterium]